MLIRRALTFRFASYQTNLDKIKPPPPPKLMHGELQTFRFDGENARLFDGYSLDELYGSKVGLKHSPAMLAEMKKDTIASILLFVLGFALILHLHRIERKQFEELNNLNENRLSRKVTLPEGLKNNLIYYHKSFEEETM